MAFWAGRPGIDRHPGRGPCVTALPAPAFQSARHVRSDAEYRPPIVHPYRHHSGRVLWRMDRRAGARGDRVVDRRVHRLHVAERRRPRGDDRRAAADLVFAAQLLFRGVRADRAGGDARQAAAGPEGRGAQRRANVEQFVNLAQRFDQFQRQGLFRFLKFIEAQRETGAEPEVAPVADENAVRLMSIHQSKGLEFPIVVVADLGKRFNFGDREKIILDEELGLCPQVKAPQARQFYPIAPRSRW